MKMIKGKHKLVEAIRINKKQKISNYEIIKIKCRKRVMKININNCNQK